MTWRRDDAIIVLASYLDRPRGMRIPPMAERERLCNVLRRSVADVTALLWAFDEAKDGVANGVAGRLWREFRDQTLQCAIRADDILAKRRRLGHRLRHSGP